MTKRLTFNDSASLFAKARVIGVLMAEMMYIMNGKSGTSRLQDKVLALRRKMIVIESDLKLDVHEAAIREMAPKL